MAFLLNKCLVLAAVVFTFISAAINAQLSSTFYDTSCPTLQSIIQSGMSQAVSQEARIGASITRLFFHDCFVQGCDGSILLADTTNFTGEQSAFPNANSVRGFDVINSIKISVEAACPSTVSCADILALAARDGVNLLGGPTWSVLLGRRDSLTASLSEANNNLPSPASDLSTLISLFSNQGLTAAEMTTLSGAHTIGQGQCKNFRNHIYNDTDIDASFATLRQSTCPKTGGDSNLAPIDVQTPTMFDNSYYQNLVVQKGLFHSDQELFNNGSQDAQVQQYSTNGDLFSSDFVNAMIKMGNINPLTGTQGEIRLNCSVIN